MRDLSALRVSPLLRATQPAAPQPAECAAQPASTLATAECATLATTTSSAERTAKPSPRLAAEPAAASARAPAATARARRGIAHSWGGRPVRGRGLGDI